MEQYLCARCGNVRCNKSAFCSGCLNLVMSCRSALHSLVQDKLIVRTSEHSWIFHPQAKEIADFVWETVERYGPLPPAQSSPLMMPMEPDAMRPEFV